MSGDIEVDVCDFCKSTTEVERTYLEPSVYIKSKNTEDNTNLYNEGNYFHMIKTCKDCGTPVISNNFESSVKSAMKYLSETHHPHTSILITCDRAELLEGQMSYVNKNFIKD